MRSTENALPHAGDLVPEVTVAPPMACRQMLLSWSVMRYRYTLAAVLCATKADGVGSFVATRRGRLRKNC